MAVTVKQGELKSRKQFFFSWLRRAREKKTYAQNTTMKLKSCRNFSVFSLLSYNFKNLRIFGLCRNGGIARIFRYSPTNKCICVYFLAENEFGIISPISKQRIKTKDKEMHKQTLYLLHYFDKKQRRSKKKHSQHDTEK